MEFRVLRYFLAVAWEESLSGAAEYLHLSQPTLSRQLKDLEEELGKQLFIRGNRRITLTEDGVLLRKRAEEIVELVQKTEDEIAYSDETVTGDVYIAAAETDQVRLLAQTMQELQEKHPSVQLHITSGGFSYVCERLDKGLSDFGLVFGPIDPAKYEQLEMPVADTWGVFMRKDSPLAQLEAVTPDDLRDKPLIFPGQVTHSSSLVKWLGGDKDSLHITATYNLVYNASRLVDEGMGYAFSLDWLINTTGESNLVFRPLSPGMEHRLLFIWKRYQIFSKAAEAFLTALREKL